MKHRILKEYKFEGERMWKVINLRSKVSEITHYIYIYIYIYCIVPRITYQAKAAVGGSS